MEEENNNKGMQQAKGGVLAQSDIELLKKSLEFSANYFGNDKNFGEIDLNIMSGFIDWLEDSKIEEKKIDINDLIYNVRIKSS